MEMRNEKIYKLEERLKQDFRNIGAALELGHLYLEENSLHRAADKFNLALSFDPMSAAAHSGLAQCYMRSDDWKNAERSLKNSLKHFPTANRYVMLGYVHKKLGSNPISIFNKALEIEPHHEEALYNLAIEFSDIDMLKSLDYLQKAVEVDASYQIAWALLGKLLLKINKTSEAKSALLNAIDLNPRDVWSVIYLGNCFFKLKKYEHSVAQFERAIEIDPGLDVARTCLEDAKQRLQKT